MNAHAHALAPSATPAGDREVRAAVAFARAGERTFVQRQEVPYPVHVTRPFRLDPDCPPLSTLYLQSASGGLYRGDLLHLDLAARAGAMAHVTTQAACVVHDCIGRGARQSTRLTVAEGAFLALTCDPYVLFPGADLTSVADIVLAPGARAILAEGVAVHDPALDGVPFARFATQTRVRTEDGRLLSAENGEIRGDAFVGRGSPLAGYRAMGTLLMLGAGERTLDRAGVERTLDGLGCLAGACAMPNGCGLAVRLLAPDGGTLSRGLEAAYRMAVESLLGFEPARRRK